MLYVRLEYIVWTFNKTDIQRPTDKAAPTAIAPSSRKWFQLKLSSFSDIFSSSKQANFLSKDELELKSGDSLSFNNNNHSTGNRLLIKWNIFKARVLRKWGNTCLILKKRVNIKIDLIEHKNWPNNFKNICIECLNTMNINWKYRPCATWNINALQFVPFIVFQKWYYINRKLKTCMQSWSGINIQTLYRCYFIGKYPAWWTSN